MDDDQTQGGVDAGAAAGDDPVMTELAELRAKVAGYEAQERRTGTFRRIGYWLLLVLSVVGIIASTIGVWSRATLLDSDQWAATVRPLVQDETVAAAVGAEIATGVVELLDVEGALAEALPDGAGLLAAPLTGALTDLLGEQAARLVQTEAFADLWEEANRLTHKAAAAVLREDEGQGGLVTQGDEVVIDLVPLLTAFLNSAGDTVSGFLPEGVELPDPSEIDGEALAAELESAFGIEIDDDFGRIVVYQADVLPEAQDAVRLLDQGAVVLVIATVVAIVGTFLLSEDRRRTLVVMASAVLGLVVVLWMLREPVRNSVLSAVTEGQPRDVASASLQIVFRQLRNDIQWVFVIALVSVIGGYLAGPGERAVALRDWARSTLDRVGGDRSDVEAEGPVARFAREHRDVLAVTGVVVAFIVVTALDRITWPGFLVVLVLLLAYEAALYVLSSHDDADDLASVGAATTDEDSPR